jgi:methyltransferase (TIGR00027 family)
MRLGKASRTAQQNALFRALDARCAPGARIANDDLAAYFLPPAFRLVAELARVPAFRRLAERFIDARWPGPRGGQVVRTAYIDELLAASVAGVRQVLMLGAGLDTRPYRIEPLRAMRVFEVDHPSTQAFKRRVVDRRLRNSAHVTFVPVDFERDDLARTITNAGFARGAPTFVLWEGVTNYLTADAVDEVFGVLRELVAPGSPIVFTYIDRAMLDGTHAFTGGAESSRAVQKVGEPYTFGLRPEDVGAYLEARGFELARDNAVSALAPRYYTNGDRPVVYDYYHVVEARKR